MPPINPVLWVRLGIAALGVVSQVLRFLSKKETCKMNRVAKLKNLNQAVKKAKEGDRNARNEILDFFDIDSSDK